METASKHAFAWCVNQRDKMKVNLHRASFHTREFFYGSIKHCPRNCLKNSFSQDRFEEVADGQREILGGIILKF